MKPALKNNLRNTVFGRYARDEQGNFALIAGVCLTLLMSVVGVAIDFSAMSSQKSRLQDIVDSAALAAAASGETSAYKIQPIVDEVMAEYYGAEDSVSYTAKIIDGNITIKADKKYKTALLGIIGYDTMPVSVVSGAPAAEELPVNLALVLDTTASMTGDNLDSLQDAAEKLVDIVKKQKSAGAKMSVVPFGNYVNIGMGNRKASWMDVPADFTKTSACFMYKPVTGKTNCSTVMKTVYVDGVPQEFEAQEGCVYTYGPETNYCPPPKEVEWKGCAGSRNEPLNLEAPASKATAIPGAMDQICGSEILPMTDDFKAVQDTIDGLSTIGNTYLSTGLLWGWRTLSPEAPFAYTKVEKTVRAMVFMTDGGNTMTQYDKDGKGDKAYHRSYQPSEVSADKDAAERMSSICANIKSDGIMLFTVGYKLPSDAFGDADLLASCASSPAHAFEADNSKELEEAFEDIGKALKVVRLSF